MPHFFSESAPMPQNRFISWDKAVFLLSGEKPPYFKGCSDFLRLFRALHVKPMRDVFALLPVPAVDGEDFFDLSRRRSPRDVDDDVDGAGDAGLLRGERYAAHEIFQAKQRIYGTVAVHGGAAASVAGRPCVHEDQRLLASHLADDDAVRREAKGFPQKIVHVYGVRRRQSDLVFCRALQFLRVFDGDDALVELGDFSKYGIEERRLAGGRAAGRDDVLLLVDGI